MPPPHGPAPARVAVGGLDPAAVDQPPGPAWCRAWTEQVDAGLRALLAEGEQRGLAVVALGSYARRELCPSSDVDLLLLHSGWARADLSDLVQRLCYPLWDAGLQVGHAVRTPADAVRAAGERIDTATALTDRRLVGGDRGLLDDLASRASRWFRRNAGRLLADLAVEDRARRARAGWRPGMLEPHLKDGAGGLRDVQGLRWAAACVVGEVGLDPLVGARYLGVASRRELAAAGELLLRARCALHLVRGTVRRPPGGELDRLRLDLQDEVGARLGYADGADLLREVGLATRTIAYVHERTWPLLTEDASGGRRWLRAAHWPRAPRPGRAAERDPRQVEPLGDGLAVRDGTVAIDADRTLAAEPSLGLRALAAAGELGLWLHRPSAERLRREVGALGTLPWDDVSRRSLLTLLRAGSAALPAFGDADFLGLLVAHLPEWAQVRGRPQRNPFHRYDLDTHLHQTVAAVVDLAAGGLSDREALLFHGLAEPDVLLLTALLHDVGKAWPPRDHSVVGAELAGVWVRRMGFPPSWADRVALLIRHHLLLFDVATRHDLDEPSELRRVADAVGDVETLDALHLLTLADARATGPSAHSPWKDALLGELHRRVRVLLGGGSGQVVPDPAQVAAAVRARGPEGVEAFLDAVEPRYLAAAGPEQVLVHAALASPPPAGRSLRASTRPGPAEGTVTLSVAAANRRGLMADCAGVLAGGGIEVLDARAFTTAGGTALDWFVVRPRKGGEVDWDGVLAALQRAAAGDLDVAEAVGDRERRRDERPRPLAAQLPVDVAFDLRAELSRVEVSAPDTPGLLYRLARTLAEAGVDVVGARIDTLGPQVRDVFFLRTDADPTTLTAALRAAATPQR